MRVVVIGTGYVGLVTGTCLAEMGNTVTCVDIDADKIKLLNAGKSPFYEPGLEEMLQRNISQQRLSFSTTLSEVIAGCEICFLAVGTPAHDDADAQVDLRPLFTAVESLIRCYNKTPLHNEALTLVIKSTVPVGTSAKLQQLVNKKEDKQTGGGELILNNINVLSNPEFLKEGHAIEDFMRPSRIVVGGETPSTMAPLKNLYRYFIRNNHTYLEMDWASAELCKYASNCMLAARISLINEFSFIAEKLGADIMEVRRGMLSDPRIGSDFLYPGIGFGGSCFPKDLQSLAKVAESCGSKSGLLDAVISVNERQKRWPLTQLELHYRDLNHKVIAIWGLSFKPQTDDVREAASIKVVVALLRRGATVQLYDPVAEKKFITAIESLPYSQKQEIQLCDSPMDAVMGAEALLLLTEWPLFRNIDLKKVYSKMHCPLVIDGRNQYDPNTMNRIGFNYYSIGRQTDDKTTI